MRQLTKLNRPTQKDGYGLYPSHHFEKDPNDQYVIE